MPSCLEACFAFRSSCFACVCFFCVVLLAGCCRLPWVSVVSVCTPLVPFASFVCVFSGPCVCPCPVCPVVLLQQLFFVFHSPRCRLAWPRRFVAVQQSPNTTSPLFISGATPLHLFLCACLSRLVPVQSMMFDVKFCCDMHDSSWKLTNCFALVHS